MDLNNFYNHSLCHLPWTSIVIETNGNFRICCFSGDMKTNDNGLVYDDNNKPMNIMTHTIEEALNSKTHNQLRQDLSNNIKHPNCLVCWTRETANKLFNEIPTSTRYKKSILYPFNKIEIKDINLVSLDLRFSNLCNMKCIMCNPIFSNLWYSDWEKLTGSKEFTFTNETYTTDTFKCNWQDSDKWWNEFDKIKHKIKHFYILGGEPFISKANEKLLDIMIDNNLAKDVFIEYDTNLSIVTESLIEKFKKFKKINIYVSCDDIEEKYELIRFPRKI